MKKCPNCNGEIPKNAVIIKTKDGVKVCSNWCKDDWNLQFNTN